MTEAIRTALEALTDEQIDVLAVKVLNDAARRGAYRTIRDCVPLMPEVAPFARDLVRAAIATLTAEMERPAPEPVAWISVEDRLPETAEPVLAWNCRVIIPGAQYYQGNWIGAGGVTHWMPLPAAPQAKDQT